jgi:type IV secretory pathway VirJ component
MHAGDIASRIALEALKCKSPACDEGPAVSVSLPQHSWLPAALLCLCLCACAPLKWAPPTEHLSYGPFRAVRIYRPQPPIAHLALLLSGDGGWGAPLDAIASRLSGQGTLVAGIDVRDLFSIYMHSPQTCVSPGEDLADLAQYLKQRYALPDAPPVLIGHSAGATLAYVALTQSRAGAFAGALTLSFCADFDLAKPLCVASGLPSLPRASGVRLLPGAAALPAPWIALHGLDDTVCPAAEAREFVGELPGAHFVGVPGVTHSYHHLNRWWAAFEGAWRQLAVPAPGVRAP